jgi:phosphoketolase
VELEHFSRGCGWTLRSVDGDDPMTMKQLMAEATDRAGAQTRHASRVSPGTH